MTVLIPRAGTSGNQATDLSLWLQKGSLQKKVPGDRELQGTLINPKQMSLAQARAPNCTAEPRAVQSPRLLSQETASAMSFAGRARSLGDLQAELVHVRTPGGLCSQGWGSSRVGHTPWNKQQIVPTFLQTKALYPFSGLACHGTASALNLQH